MKIKKLKCIVCNNKTNRIFHIYEQAWKSHNKNIIAHKLSKNNLDVYCCDICYDTINHEYLINYCKNCNKYILEFFSFDESKCYHDNECKKCIVKNSNKIIRISKFKELS